jgi:hypothetical protein
MTESPVAAGFLGPRMGAGPSPQPDDEVVELPLLLPRWQAEALEEAAHSRGLTAGQMMRKLLGQGLREIDPDHG